ncbi:hypothetical protein DFH07DRAFT_997495 [Mycena maculata]|uniref:Uncharacterized protein n=1 Tax=Mycena maculata TaxID=230809 RepID=A0AAD7P1N5_9AGAR|nr:hypothetical protein DFH07DRAFT_997495 [Mycena maculata]
MKQPEPPVRPTIIRTIRSVRAGKGQYYYPSRQATRESQGNMITPSAYATLFAEDLWVRPDPLIRYPTRDASASLLSAGKGQDYAVGICQDEGPRVRPDPLIVALKNDYHYAFGDVRLSPMILTSFLSLSLVLRHALYDHSNEHRKKSLPVFPSPTQPALSQLRGTEVARRFSTWLKDGGEEKGRGRKEIVHEETHDDTVAKYVHIHARGSHGAALTTRRWILTPLTAPKTTIPARPSPSHHDENALPASCGREDVVRAHAILYVPLNLQRACGPMPSMSHHYLRTT